MVTYGPLKVPGDFVIHVESLEYCTKSVRIGNPTGADIIMDDIIAYPLIAGTNGADYDLAMAGDEDAVVAFLMDGEAGQGSETIAAGEVGTQWYQALVNAPAICNRDKIPTVDFVDADFDVDAIVTAMEALKFEFRSEPVLSSTL